MSLWVSCLLDDILAVACSSFVPRRRYTLTHPQTHDTAPGVRLEYIISYTGTVLLQPQQKTDCHQGRVTAGMSLEPSNAHSAQKKQEPTDSNST